MAGEQLLLYNVHVTYFVHSCEVQAVYK